MTEADEVAATMLPKYLESPCKGNVRVTTR